MSLSTARRARAKCVDPMVALPSEESSVQVLDNPKAYWRLADCERVTGNPEVIDSSVGLLPKNAHLVSA